MMRLMSRQKMTVCFERDEMNQKKNGLGQTGEMKQRVDSIDMVKYGMSDL